MSVSINIRKIDLWRIMQKQSGESDEVFEKLFQEARTKEFWRASLYDFENNRAISLESDNFEVASEEPAKDALRQLCYKVADQLVKHTLEIST